MYLNAHVRYHVIMALAMHADPVETQSRLFFFVFFCLNMEMYMQDWSLRSGDDLEKISSQQISMTSKVFE